MEENDVEKNEKSLRNTLSNNYKTIIIAVIVGGVVYTFGSYFVIGNG
jgi:hypothetical protein